MLLSLLRASPFPISRARNCWQNRGKTNSTLSGSHINLIKSVTCMFWLELIL